MVVIHEQFGFIEQDSLIGSPVGFVHGAGSGDHNLTNSLGGLDETKTIFNHRRETS